MRVARQLEEDREMHAGAPDFGAEVHEAASELGVVRKSWRRSERAAVERFPSRTAIARVVTLLEAALFPRRLGGWRGGAQAEDSFVADALGNALRILHAEAESEFAYWQSESATAFEPDQAAITIRHFAARLAPIRAMVDSDVEAAFLGDPAATSVDEILVCYPGAVAILHHRLAHELHKLGSPIVARIISELANERTGIDIHPGATIGPSFFIDHGTGVVIGETAIIGARVKLYQHVTLGATAPLGIAHVSARTRYARHPIVEDDVTIYAGATLLGRITIGRRSTIGGNVWLLNDVPPDSVVLQPAAGIAARGDSADVRDLLSGRRR